MFQIIAKVQKQNIKNMKKKIKKEKKYMIIIMEKEIKLMNYITKRRK
jgi:hypothetical protein